MVDSLIEVYSDTTIINDTAYITMWETKNFTKTFVIHDTLRSVIVDNARVKLLQADLSKANAKLKQWKDKANNRLGWLIISLLYIGSFLYFKFKR
jgi:hypothetical protein